MSTYATILGAIAAVVLMVAAALIERGTNDLFSAILSKLPPQVRLVFYSSFVIGAFLLVYFITANTLDIKRDEEFELRILGEDSRMSDAGLYIIGGDEVINYNMGDDLVVYDYISPNTLGPIALLRVVAKNLDTLSAQSILIHPSYPIKALQNVNDDINQLQFSILTPYNVDAVGYLINEGQIRLVSSSSNSTLTSGTILMALSPVIQESITVDYLPQIPPTYIQIENIGIDAKVAQVKLMEGGWPELGTLFVLQQIVPVEPIYTATPQPVVATITSTSTPVISVTSTTEITQPSTQTIPPVPHYCNEVGGEIIEGFDVETSGWEEQENERVSVKYENSQLKMDLLQEDSIASSKLNTCYYNFRIRVDVTRNGIEDAIGYASVRFGGVGSAYYELDIYTGNKPGLQLWWVPERGATQKTNILGGSIIETGNSSNTIELELKEGYLFMGLNGQDVGSVKIDPRWGYVALASCNCNSEQPNISFYFDNLSIIPLNEQQ